jgi:hypothetical protein
MPGIAHLDARAFHDRILRMRDGYVQDWQVWMDTLHSQEDVAWLLGRTLRKWQACRPNRMRRTASEATHDPPFLEDLIAEAHPFVLVLQSFDLRHHSSFTPSTKDALAQLWHTFEKLSHQGRANNARTGIVGISKAVMLLTEGRVGPAFDSTVRAKLGMRAPEDPGQWIQALQAATTDICAFETANTCTLQAASPSRFVKFHSGRIYDMALGPGGA